MSTKPSSPPPPSSSPQPNEEASSTTHQPPFEPLFTLLSNTTTNTTSHPRVHYIFSDDEPTILPPSRSILIDLEAASEASPTNSAAWTVKSASSLSSDFAITDTKLEGEGMLRVEGVQREAVAPAPALGKSKEGEGEDVEGLLEDFRRRMGVLKRVVEQGERSVGYLKMGDGEQQEEGQGESKQQEGSGSGSGSAEKVKEKTEDT